MEHIFSSDLSRAKTALERADAIMILAGAGMGVDSGLPDFRGNEGFWKAYPPIKKLGLSFVEMANPDWFIKNPELAWGFYGHRLNLYRETTPHKGFEMLLKYAKSKPGGYFVFTSNVDGQFQKAGFDENLIEEVHGSIHHLQCSERCSNDVWSAKDTAVKVNEETFWAEGELPHCPKCGAIARPNILMFNDWHWINKRAEIQRGNLNFWLSRNLYKSIVVIEIGAGNAVPTVRMTSEKMVSEFDAKLIRINPRDFNVPKGQISITKNAMIGIRTILM